MEKVFTFEGSDMGDKDDKARPEDRPARDDKTPPEDRPARDEKIDKAAQDSDWRYKQ